MKIVPADNRFNTGKVAFILGAGFSKCADLPVQSEFSTLLTSNEFQTPIDLLITKVIKDFFVDVFGWKHGTEIPTVEDIFTFIDLSAGTGHHLGIKYKPNRLRAIRRMLIHRVFQIIDHRFKYSSEIETLLKHFKKNDCSFISMNWDIVLEKHLLQAIEFGRQINYVTPSFDWSNHERGNPEGGIKICKMHGSSNWAYCENCKTLFYLLDEKLSLHKKVGLIKSDFRLFDESFLDTHFDESIGLNPKERSCRICNNSVATHIATFSYRKSFRTSAYPAIWSEAENILANATKWIFIGYSMPAADFELKHLIKSAQLRFKHKGQKREIEVVIYKDQTTKDTFTKFFGSDNINIFDNGLAEYVSKL
jgi:hypothetical protein